MKALFTTLALSVSAPAHAIMFERPDGARFDSDVGAACGALSTAVHFEPTDGEVDLHDEPVLDHLAECLTHGPLQGVAVGIIAAGDRGLPYEVSLSLANERARSVRDYLIDKGVPYWQLEAWGLSRGFDGASAEAGFRVIDPTVTVDARPVR
ncbi:MAG TPA: hypothetical protein PK095_08670 [Myxococcota bacterium]|nr:hypothetical protein [Myxococcota bacterium]